MLKVQKFNDSEIRTILFNEEWWFVAKDVSVALEYSETSAMTRHLDKEELYNCTDLSIVKLIGVDNRVKNMTLITEKGLLELISKSEKITLSKKHELIKELFPYKDIVVIDSRKEILFIEKLIKTLEPLDLIMIKQYKVNNYRIDLYIKDWNIAIEYDENDHMSYTHNQHKGRQIEIENKLGCTFLRLSDNKSDEHNIGIVFNEILNKSTSYALNNASEILEDGEYMMSYSNN